MRLPLGRIYRAYPELDPLDDESCRRLMARVKATHPGALSAAALASFGIMLVGAILAVVAIAARLFPISAWADIPAWLDGLLIILTIAMIAGAALHLYDRAVRGMVRRLVREHEICAECGYSLRGLPDTGGVTCPECGCRAGTERKTAILQQ